MIHAALYCFPVCLKINCLKNSSHVLLRCFLLYTQYTVDRKTQRKSKREWREVLRIVVCKGPNTRPNRYECEALTIQNRWKLYYSTSKVTKLSNGNRTLLMQSVDNESSRYMNIQFVCWWRFFGSGLILPRPLYVYGIMFGVYCCHFFHLIFSSFFFLNWTLVGMRKRRKKIFPRFLHFFRDIHILYFIFVKTPYAAVRRNQRIKCSAVRLKWAQNDGFNVSVCIVW